jgi:hypothetical protein
MYDCLLQGPPFRLLFIVALRGVVSSLSGYKSPDCAGDNIEENFFLQARMEVNWSIAGKK